MSCINVEACCDANRSATGVVVTSEVFEVRFWLLSPARQQFSILIGQDCWDGAVVAAPATRSGK